MANNFLTIQFLLTKKNAFKKIDFNIDMNNILPRFLSI